MNHQLNFEIDGVRLTLEATNFTKTAEEEKAMHRLVFGLSGQEVSARLLEEAEILALRFSHIPTFLNFVVDIHLKELNFGRAEAALRELRNKFPSYLFGIATQAVRMVQTGRPPEEVLELLGPTLRLPRLLPDRNRFHVAEFLAYYRACIYYLTQTNQLDKARRYLDLMEKVGPDNHLTLDAYKQVSVAQLDSTLAKTREELKELEEQALASRKELMEMANVQVEQREAPPLLHHQEVLALYEHGLEIDPEIFRQILALPRETLIQDLEAVATDMAYRFYTLFDQVSHEEGSASFSFHALFLLAELEATESYPTLVFCLSQSEVLLDFWYGSIFQETMWEVMYHLGKDRLEDLQAFFLDPKVSEYSRSLVCQVVEAISLTQPERMPELQQWMKSSLEKLHASQLGMDSYPLYLNSCLLLLSSTLGFDDLEKQEKAFFEYDMVDLSITGDWDSFQAFKKKKHPQNDLYTPCESIFELYEWLQPED